MKLAIEDILIRRDMYLHNAAVAHEAGDMTEWRRLRQIAIELEDAAMILEDRGS